MAEFFPVFSMVNTRLFLGICRGKDCLYSRSLPMMSDHEASRFAQPQPRDPYGPALSGPGEWRPRRERLLKPSYSCLLLTLLFPFQVLDGLPNHQGIQPDGADTITPNPFQRRPFLSVYRNGKT